MNTNLQVFQFENFSIRTVELEGVIWFVAKDVASILGYENTAQAVRTHCRKAKSLIDMGCCSAAPTLDPQIKLIPESDVYRLTIKSTLESAEKFQDWIVEEVLPSIRKTGQYQVSQMQPLALTQHDLATRQLKNELEVWNLLECPLHIAQQEIVKLVRKDTGVDFSAALKYAKAQQNILPTEIMLEPTELASELGLQSAAAVNCFLENLDLQVKVGKVWEPTSTGQLLCQKHAWAKGSKSGYNLKWNLKGIEALLD
jgi:prophage antirepressor-like protein